MQGSDPRSEKGKIMKIIGIIPARMASSRFSGKPLAKICGLEMLAHVYLRSKMCSRLNEVYVATCDSEIDDYVKSIHGKTIMTKSTHERASDRCAEALEKIERETGKETDIVVMIQGDEPMIQPSMIDQAIEPLMKDKSIKVVNLMGPIESVEELTDPNEVKVVVDQKNYALYFSREPIPYFKKTLRKITLFKQVCVIPFRRDFLYEFNRLPSTPLEQIESIDMLRVLEHGHRIKMVPTNQKTYSVDTPEDLVYVEKEMLHDPLFKEYGIAFVSDRVNQ